MAVPPVFCGGCSVCVLRWLFRLRSTVAVPLTFYGGRSAHVLRWLLLCLSTMIDSSFLDFGGTDNMIVITQLKEEVQALKKQLTAKEQQILERDKKVSRLNAARTVFDLISEQSA